MKRFLSKLLLLMTLLGISMMSWADRLPAYYPGGFENIGVVDALSRGQSTMVIGDVQFYVSPKTKVHGLHSRNVTLGWLKTGALIGFTADGDFITEIWVLPQGYKPWGRE